MQRKITKKPRGKLKLNLKKSAQTIKKIEKEEQWENKKNKNKTEKKISMVAANSTIPIITLNTNELKPFI